MRTVSMRHHTVAALVAIALPYAIASVALVVAIIVGEVVLALMTSTSGPSDAPAVAVDGLTRWLIPAVAITTALLVGTRLPRHLRAERSSATIVIIAGALATIGATLGPVNAVTLLQAAAPAVAVLAGFWWGRSAGRE